MDEDDLLKIIKNTDDPIYAELLKIYSPEAIERWIDPDNFGPIENADAHASVSGRCGDRMEIFLKVSGDRVIKSSYMTDGCASSNICGSFAADMAMNKGPDEIIEITGEAVMERAGGLPEEDRHCAFLAAETLQAALDVYMKKQKQLKG
ncbi:MAG: iron-sulfur cluster assembly scaffold protein [Deltaproteobacteria bacterium]|nr:iron-sulfur cluster assembly scaffold protein [Deltaproteobacteria bacterium]